MNWTIYRCALLTGLRTYQSHYNAACMYAIPLSEEKLTDEYRGELTRRAIMRLELATSYADSAFLAGRQNWLISQDPDLEGLRLQPEFWDLISMYFPASPDHPHRPACARELEQARYASETVQEIAREWAALWRRRSQNISEEIEPDTVSRWRQDERQAWDFIRKLRSRRAAEATRLELVKARRDWSGRYRTDFVEPSFPRYEDNPLDYDPNAPDDAAREEIKRLDRRVIRLAHQLFKSSGPNPHLPANPGGHSEASLLRPSRPLPLRHRRLENLCLSRAALWKSVYELLAADRETETDRREDLTRAVEQMAQYEQ